MAGRSMNRHRALARKASAGLTTFHGIFAVTFSYPAIQENGRRQPITATGSQSG